MEFQLISQSNILSCRIAGFFGYSPRREVLGSFCWLGVVRHGQPHSSVSVLASVLFVGLEVIARLEIV